MHLDCIFMNSLVSPKLLYKYLSVGIVTSKVKLLEIFLTNEIGLKIKLITKTEAMLE